MSFIFIMGFILNLFGVVFLFSELKVTQNLEIFDSWENGRNKQKGWTVIEHVPLFYAGIELILFGCFIQILCLLKYWGLKGEAFSIVISISIIMAILVYAYILGRQSKRKEK